jgi:CIDE-N domain
LKIWDSWRNIRKGLVVGSFEELIVRGNVNYIFVIKQKKVNDIIVLLGKDKLGIPASEPVRLVLESDGTQVEDGEYFRTLANNTILLLLRQGERWYPTGGFCNFSHLFIHNFSFLSFSLSHFVINRC